MLTKIHACTPKMGIWFPHGFGNLFHAINDIRAADAEGKYLLVCSHPHSQFVGLEAADIALAEPTDDGQFLNFAIKAILAHNIRVIVPSRRQPFFNRHAALWAKMGVRVLTVASSPALARIENKVALYRHLQPRGIVAVPGFGEFKTSSEFDAHYLQLKRSYPRLCLKPAYGVYGSGFRVLKTEKDNLSDLLSESLSLSVGGLRARLAVDPGASMMLMQYLEGDERSVDCLADNGKLLAAVVRRKSGSSVAAQVIEQHPVIEAQVNALTKHLRLNGLFNVQFKDTGGVPYLLEINPRLSGRSYYATVAGCNLPYLAAEHFAAGVPADQLVFAVQHGLRIGNVSAPVVIAAPCNGYRGPRESA